jgi:hypothetical protein
MDVGYNYHSDSSYSAGAVQGQYKYWLSRRKRYAGSGALERDLTKTGGIK